MTRDIWTRQPVKGKVALAWGAVLFAIEVWTYGVVAAFVGALASIIGLWFALIVLDWLRHQVQARNREDAARKAARRSATADQPLRNTSEARAVVHLPGTPPPAAPPPVVASPPAAMVAPAPAKQPLPAPIAGRQADNTAPRRRTENSPVADIVDLSEVLREAEMALLILRGPDPSSAFWSPTGTGGRALSRVESAVRVLREAEQKPAPTEDEP